MVMTDETFLMILNHCANDLLAGGAQISFVEVEYIQWLDHFVVHFDVFFQY